MLLEHSTSSDHGDNFIAFCIICCWYLQFCSLPAERLGRAIHTTLERYTQHLLSTFESWLRWCQGGWARSYVQKLVALVSDEQAEPRGGGWGGVGR